MALTHSTFEELFTAIANSIREKKNSTEAIIADNFPAEIAALESNSGGIDTSDATATTNDIAVGTSAYINGIKVDGSIPIITAMQPTAANNQYMASVSGNPVQINFTYTNPSRMIVEAGATMVLGAVLPNFGSVQPGDVIKGQTFTFTAGLKKTGTLTLDNEISTQQNLISQIQETLEGREITSISTTITFDRSQMALPIDIYVADLESWDIIRYIPADQNSFELIYTGKEYAVAALQWDVDMYGDYTPQMRVGISFTPASESYHLCIDFGPTIAGMCLNPEGYYDWHLNMCSDDPIISQIYSTYPPNDFICYIPIDLNLLVRSGLPTVYLSSYAIV